MKRLNISQVAAHFFSFSFSRNYHYFVLDKTFTHWYELKCIVRQSFCFGLYFQAAIRLLKFIIDIVQQLVSIRIFISCQQHNYLNLAFIFHPFHHDRFCYRIQVLVFICQLLHFVHSLILCLMYKIYSAISYSPLCLSNMLCFSGCFSFAFIFLHFGLSFEGLILLPLSELCPGHCWSIL